MLNANQFGDPTPDSGSNLLGMLGDLRSSEASERVERRRTPREQQRSFTPLEQVLVDGLNEAEGRRASN